jgi:hypothetical protein
MILPHTYTLHYLIVGHIDLDLAFSENKDLTLFTLDIIIAKYEKREMGFNLRMRSLEIRQPHLLSLQQRISLHSAALSEDSAG